MRILVCGSRIWKDREGIKVNLASYAAHDPVVIHGGARGADTIAGEVAKELGFEVEVFPADWNKHGKTAGFIRNQQMLDEGKPDRLLAFHLNNSRGTQDMIDRAQKAGLLTIVWG
ncbi:hypothetical protein LCGC14_1088550 [marine sediment metagenome]|uniref:YspA cpYpsA-related SLOG domain-containing protein n=1 Tax=marine sediment metagenome TaxID=412755 RepID=A0A0F9N0S9_9ZZZZ